MRRLPPTLKNSRLPELSRLYRPLMEMPRSLHACDGDTSRGLRSGAPPPWAWPPSKRLAIPKSSDLGLTGRPKRA